MKKLAGTCSHDLIHQKQLRGDDGGALQDLLLDQVVVEDAGNYRVDRLSSCHVQTHDVPRLMLLLPQQVADRKCHSSTTEHLMPNLDQWSLVGSPFVHGMVQEAAKYKRYIMTAQFEAMWLFKVKFLCSCLCTCSTVTSI